MKKIVIDTNIFVSALFSNKGASFKLIALILQLFEDKKIKLNCISVPSILELEDVMFRPCFSERLSHLSKEELDGYIDDIVFISSKTKLSYLWRPFLKDADDDKILETAINSQAKCIVTYNIKDFKNVEKYFDIKIITPNNYLSMIEQEKEML